MFQEHRDRNAARGWTLGDNMHRAAQQKQIEPGWGGEEQKVRRPPMVMTPDQRAFVELLDEITDRQMRADREKIEGQKKEAERQARTRQQQRTRDTGIARSRAGAHASGLATAALVIGDALYSRAAARLDEQWRRRRRLRSNRRGALAQRSPDPVRARTGRTAAGDTGRTASSSSFPEQSGSGDATARRPRHDSGTGVRSASQSGTQPQHETTGSVEAKRVMESSRSLPQQATSSAAASRLAQLAQFGLPTALTSAFRSSPAVRSASRSATSTAFSPSLRGGSGTRSPSALGLTAIEAQGVQSASSDPRCRCPQPPKKKRREPGCRNPVISRTVKDGIRTTKVKLQCPPSKPKFP